MLPDNKYAGDYWFEIEQIKDSDGSSTSNGVTLSGMRLSEPIDRGVSAFKLWGYRLSTGENWLLDSKVATGHLPTATLTLHSEDTVPYPYLRTRADRPFSIEITTSGIETGEQWPVSSKGVKFTSHVRANYPPSGGETLVGESTISTNGTQTSTVLHSIPAADSSKATGEQRISIYTQEDPESGVVPEILASQTIQIWPVAEATITGISEGQTIGPQVPNLTLNLKNAYPTSTTWAQVYLGSPRGGATGTFVPGSAWVVSMSEPSNLIMQVSNYGSVFDTDGPWTLEILTQTPFGVDRVTAVSFHVQGKGMTLEGWRQTHFGNTANSGDGADDSDFDKDGIKNLLEFAFGLNPKEANSDALPKPRRSDQNLIISFTEPSGVRGILYQAEWSPNLEPDSWQAISDSGTAPDHAFVLSMADGPQGFIRIKVSKP